MAGKKIRLQAEDEVLELYVVEQTMLGNVNYVLVTDSDDEDEEEANAYILKETGSEVEDAIYEFVEDDRELEAISRIFAEMLEDIDLQ